MNIVLKIKQIVLSIVGKLSERGRIAFAISYVHNRHKIPHFSNPKDLSEIWIKRVLDGKVDGLAYLADKHAVRAYVESKGLGNLLTPEIAVYNSAEEIDFSTLPERFALKANFGAGMNIICKDKSQLNETAVRLQVRDWLNIKTYSFSELHYNLISKKFICEEFIDDGTGGFPVDYKFMCINGKVHCILACSGREKGHADYLPYSVDWKPMYHYYKSYPKDIELLKAPANLSDMIHTAEKLAEDIELVRIDLYSNGSQIWFGEITLTPAGCIFHRWSNKAMDEMGRIYLNEKTK